MLWTARAALALLVLVPAVRAADTPKAKGTSKPDSLAVGKTAPDIEGEDSKGKKFKLSGFRGKVVVIDFWASW